jgi:hypothetical protein
MSPVPIWYEFLLNLHIYLFPTGLRNSHIKEAGRSISLLIGQAFLLSAGKPHINLNEGETIIYVTSV